MFWLRVTKTLYTLFSTNIWGDTPPRIDFFFFNEKMSNFIQMKIILKWILLTIIASRLPNDIKILDQFKEELGHVC